MVLILRKFADDAAAVMHGLTSAYFHSVKCLVQALSRASHCYDPFMLVHAAA